VIAERALRVMDREKVSICDIELRGSLSDNENAAYRNNGRDVGPFSRRFDEQ
jgi:hypothetical protein